MLMHLLSRKLSLEGLCRGSGCISCLSRTIYTPSGQPAPLCHALPTGQSPSTVVGHPQSLKSPACALYRQKYSTSCFSGTIVKLHKLSPKSLHDCCGCCGLLVQQRMRHRVQPSKVCQKTCTLRLNDKNALCDHQLPGQMTHLCASRVCLDCCPILAQLLPLHKEILPSKVLRQDESAESKRREERRISQTQMVTSDKGALHEPVQDVQLECQTFYGLRSLRYLHLLVHGTLQGSAPGSVATLPVLLCSHTPYLCV